MWKQKCCKFCQFHGKTSGQSQDAYSITVKSRIVVERFYKIPLCICVVCIDCNACLTHEVIAQSAAFRGFEYFEFYEGNGRCFTEFFHFIFSFCWFMSGHFYFLLYLNSQFLLDFYACLQVFRNYRYSSTQQLIAPPECVENQQFSLFSALFLS